MTAQHWWDLETSWSQCSVVARRGTPRVPACVYLLLLWLSIAAGGVMDQAGDWRTGIGGSE